MPTFVQDDSIPEAADYTDICISDPKKNPGPFFVNGSIITQIPPNSGTGCLLGDVIIAGHTFSFPKQQIVLPASSFILQSGSIEPLYPTFSGAFVYDTQYKKWGKMKQEFTQIFDLAPINSHAGNAPVPYDIFNVSAACMLPSGKMAIFDKYPADSIIKYGKIGYYRNGYTDCEGVDVQFRNKSTGSVQLEGSIDGKLIHPAISQIQPFADVYSIVAGFTSSARWFNVSVSGIYDIKNINFRGEKKGKR
jgi:hypothetical protein